MGAVFYISALRTVGYVGSYGDYYMEEFAITYSVDGSNWISARNDNGDTTFQGNTDTSNTIENNFNVDYIQAQYVRFVCVTWEGVYASIRWELMGCQADTSVTPECAASDVGPCTPEEIDVVSQQDSSAFSASSDQEYGEAHRSDYQDFGWKAESNDNNPWLQVSSVTVRHRQKFLVLVSGFDIFNENTRTKEESGEITVCVRIQTTFLSLTLFPSSNEAVSYAWARLLRASM